MKVRLPWSLRVLTRGESVVEESANTIGDLIARLDERYPGVKRQVCEPDGRLKRFVNVFVNGKDIRSLQGLATRLVDSDEVSIVPAMAGGRP